MLKLEIKMDEEKIIADQKYRVESIYQVLKSVFSRYGLKRTEKMKMIFPWKMCCIIIQRSRV